MKKILIVSILLCFGLLGYSQTFPLKSSKWYYANNGGSQPPNSTLRIVQYEKDTVVNDTLSQMLSNGLIFYSEKDSVFYYNPDQNRFGLLYDYSAEVGDTIELITPAGTPSDKLSFKI